MIISLVKIILYEKIQAGALGDLFECEPKSGTVFPNPVGMPAEGLSLGDKARDRAPV